MYGLSKENDWKTFATFESASEIKNTLKKSFSLVEVVLTETVMPEDRPEYFMYAGKTQDGTTTAGRLRVDKILVV